MAKRKKNSTADTPPVVKETNLEDDVEIQIVEKEDATNENNDSDTANTDTADNSDTDTNSDDTNLTEEDTDAGLNEDTDTEVKAATNSEVEDSIKKDALARLDNSFKSLNDSFKDGTATIVNQKVVFNSILQALNVAPSEAVAAIGSVPDNYPLTVDASALRFDHLWDDNDKKGAFNALISMLSVKGKVIDAHYMEMSSLKTALLPFGDNSHYLASLYTEV